MTAIHNTSIEERRAVRRHREALELLRGVRQPANHLEMLGAIQDAVREGWVSTRELVLPFVFRLNKQPYSLLNYLPFGPMFDVELPKRQLWLTGRQLGKSSGMAAESVLTATCGSATRMTILHVSPRYEQIRRFSAGYVRGFIQHSPVRHLMMKSGLQDSVLSKQFLSGAELLFSFALLDAERVRGVSADRVKIDEVQDMDEAHLPIIGETMSASHLGSGLWTYTGTAKTTDNTIQTLFDDSSQCEWFVPCFKCGKKNIPALEHDLLRMIGPYSPDISEARPGTICAKCRRPVSPKYGTWVPRYPEKHHAFAGYHVPQLILPLHYADKNKWHALLAKMNSKTAAPHVFINEILGCSSSAGSELITLEDLMGAGTLPWENDFDRPAPEMLERLDDYDIRVLACDWGGGGVEEVSYTKIALVGWRPGATHVLWGKQLLTPHRPDLEAEEVLHWFQRFNCDYLAHDYTGAGATRETILLQTGVALESLLPFSYTGAHTTDLVVNRPATAQRHRAFLSIDKARSLTLTCQCLRAKIIRTFRYDNVSVDDPGLLRDFRALRDEKIESPTGKDIYRVRRAGKQSDDFAHAVNLGVHACWYRSGDWPDLAKSVMENPRFRISEEDLKVLGNVDHGWEQDGPEALL